MHNVAVNKGLNHPEVLEISQKLDCEIVILQQFLITSHTKFTEFPK